MYYNARSLINNLHDLHNLCVLCSSLNIIAFTEAWFSDNNTHNLIQLYANDYTIYRCGRNSRGGGTATFVHNNIHSLHLRNINVLDIESVWCKMYIPDGNNFITYIIGF